MFGFVRSWLDESLNKNNITTDTAETADTFVEATGGGWTEYPDVIDSSSYEDYINRFLRDAYRHAIENNVQIGEEFTYKLTDIPVGIVSPHEISFGIIMQAVRYNLRPGPVIDESVQFVRIR